MAKKLPTKSSYQSMPKVKRQQLNSSTNERRKAREEDKPDLAEKRLAKQRAYDAKKRLQRKNGILEIQKTIDEKSVSQMSSDSLLNWYKTLNEEKNQLGK